MKNHTNLLDNYQRSHYDTITIGPKGKFHWVLQLINSQKVPEGTDFGQSRFGHPDLTKFGQSNFGQFWPNPILANPFLARISVSVVSQSVRPRRVGARRGVGPRRVGAQNFALFFPSPPSFSLFFVSLWVSSRGFLVVFASAGPSNVHVWSSRVVV